MPTTIYIVRHGQSHGNVAENSIKPVDWDQWGELQAPLTKLGEQQAKKISEKLKNVHFDSIFSSDLNRARETAEIIAKERDIAVQTESTIRERNFGKLFFGLKPDERKQLRKAVEELNDEELWLHKFSEDGESIKEALDRFKAFLEKITPLYKGKTILVVNHGNIMRTFLVYLKWAKFNELPPGSIVNTGFFVIEMDEGKINIIKTEGVTKSNLDNEE